MIFYEASDRLLGQNATGPVYEKLDGSRYVIEQYTGTGFPCTPGASICELAVGPSYPGSVGLDALAITEAQLRDTFNPEALSLLSFSQPQGALRALVDAAPYAPGGIVQIADAYPQAAAAANAQSTQIINTLLATTDRDPRDGKTAIEQLLDGYERSFTAERRAANAANLADAQRRLAVAIFGDDFGSNTIDFGSSLPTFAPSYSLPTYTFANTNPDVSYGDVGSPPITENGGGGIFDSIVGALPTILRGVVDLSRAGVIRGSVGELFAGSNGSVGAAPMAVAAPAPFGGSNMAFSFNDALNYALSAYAQAQGSVQMGVGDMPATAPGAMVPVGPQQLVAGNCGQSRTRYVDMMTAPGIYKLGCRGFQPVSKVVAQNMDGSRDLFVRVGKIIAPSQKSLQRVARQLARQAHCTVTSRSSYRRSRVVYRRRRPR